jgi:transposase
VAEVAECLGGSALGLEPGGSVHSVLRAASRCEPVYEAIHQTVGQAAWVVPDETGWQMGGHPAWLHTLVGPEATAYVIDPTRSGTVAEAILGLDYDGTMIHDGWSPYDQFANAHHQQCLNHLLRRADEVVQMRATGASVTEIAGLFGVSTQRIRQLLLRARRLVCRGRGG